MTSFSHPMFWEKHTAFHFLKGGKRMAFICFDVGGTAVKHGVYSNNGQLVEKNDFPTPHADKESFYQALSQTITDYEKDYKIEGIGLSIPGFINPHSGEAITAGALLNFYGENILEGLKDYTDYPIAIENDANCAALAEQASGNAQDVDSFLLITIGTGIGGAIVLNQQLHQGYSYRAGEFGLMHLDVANRPLMTAHDLASTSALVRDYKIHKNLPADTVVDARQIMIEKETDPAVQAVFDNWLTYLSALIFNSSTFFNPDKILLGGGISANESLIPAIEAQLEKDPAWKEMKTTIQSCHYYNEAGLRGALALITEQVSRQQTAVEGV